MSKQQSLMTSFWSQNDSDSDDSVIMLDDLPPRCSASQKVANKADITITKPASSKKASQWVSSAFGAFDGFGDFDVKKAENVQKTKQSTVPNRSMALKRSHPSSSRDELFGGRQALRRETTVSRRQSKLPETELWAEKYIPKNQEELAVHKKKIQEVESWMKHHMSSDGHKSSILLLTGPAGVGKTASVKVLAKELQCYLHEWTNPVYETYQGEVSMEEFRNRSALDRLSNGSQLSQFQDFLLRANKYNTLDISGTGVANKKIILVEEFPNVFYRDPGPFHDILRKYLKVGSSPLVFIVSDSSKGESNERLLFPKLLQQQLQIENISFNPIAQTSMTKILTKVATQEANQGSLRFTVPSKCVIESIAMASAGDVRGALNALQFACLKDTTDLTETMLGKGKARPSVTKRGSSMNKKMSRNTKTNPGSKSNQQGSTSNDDALAAIGGRDTSLFLFRALGKILYCKREEPDTEVIKAQLPDHLSQHYRDPLQFVPEDVVEKSHLSGDFFNAYLHQNYLDFYSSIEDIVGASEYLSDADFLTINWTSRSTLQMYAASVASRAIVFCNTPRARHNHTSGSGLGWKPLHKPQWYSVGRQARQNCESARSLFRGYRSPPEVLQTEILPYISLINSTLHDTGQISFIQEICKFSSHRGIGGTSEKLDEKDIDIDTEEYSSSQQLPGQSASSKGLPLETNDVMSSSQSNVTGSLGAEEGVDEEEYDIEDFDDDF